MNAPGTDEGSRAQHWRQRIMGLSIKELADLTGYSVTAIRCFEANANTSGEIIGEKAWQRYRMACAGIFWHQQHKFKIKIGDSFDWTQGKDRLYASQQR